MYSSNVASLAGGKNPSGSWKRLPKSVSASLSDCESIAGRDTNQRGANDIL